MGGGRFKTDENLGRWLAEMTFDSPMFNGSRMARWPRPWRTLAFWTLGILAIGGRYVCPAVVLLPYLVIVRMTDRLIWQGAALALMLMFLALCGLAIGGLAWRRLRTERVIDLDDAAFTLGCLFWAVFGCLYIINPV